MIRERRFALPRMAQVALVWLLLAVSTAALLTTGWQWIGDIRGAKVDAQIVSITTNVPGRRVYEVQLLTRSGHTCVTKVDSGSNPPPREIRVGAMSRLHYSAHNTCADFSVRESTSSSPGSFVIVAALAIVACLVTLWRLRRYGSEG